MSRRHHGRSRHANGRGDENRAQAPSEPRGVVAERLPTPPAVEPARAAVPDVPPAPAPAEAAVPPTNGTVRTDGSPPANVPASANGSAPTNGYAGNGHDVERTGCTAPQLRRFIKSRPYVPMHELRRRFGINGAEDDVTPLLLHEGSIYVGLPEREGRLLGELVRGGEVGYELSLDPRTPIVVGVYPMRPVPRA